MAFFNPQPYNPGALVASYVPKTVTILGGLVRLHRLIATNTNAAVRYIQIFDASSLPADGAVPLISFPLAAAASTQPPIDFGVYGRTFSVGVVVCNSTTEGTKTIGSADSFFDLLIS